MILDPLLDMFRGKAVTIPPMDGALRPNMALEEAEVLANAKTPDNLVSFGGRMIFSSSASLLDLSGETLASFSAPICAMAAADGVLAAALDSGRIEIRDGTFSSVGKTITGFTCPVALAFDGPGTLYICNGSETVSPADWKSDLMQKGATGSVWRVTLSTGERQQLAQGLAFPYGLSLDHANNRLVVSESWRHRLIALPLSGGPQTTILDQLPGYPARINPRSSGGFLLSLFAPRNRLIEFVLLEDAYRTDMMAEIDSENWIAPSLSASRSFLEPLQSGGVRSMGIHKPWSPSRSYGLVAILDQNFQPTASFHSRANGNRHGITSAIEHAGAMFAASKGGNVVLRLPLDETVS